MTFDLISDSKRINITLVDTLNPISLTCCYLTALHSYFLAHNRDIVRLLAFRQSECLSNFIIEILGRSWNQVASQHLDSVSFQSYLGLHKGIHVLLVNRVE